MNGYQIKSRKGFKNWLQSHKADGKSRKLNETTMESATKIISTTILPSSTKTTVISSLTKSETKPTIATPSTVTTPSRLKKPPFAHTNSSPSK